jgi:hypothetical protein
MGFRMGTEMTEVGMSSISIRHTGSKGSIERCTNGFATAFEESWNDKGRASG